ncbi:MAG: cyclopropane-fatty-acyl-phospholipid synthase [Actinomycetota bacterium]|nr:cyclopropane-fatty-acyl-phospholipid synthase [Actinomycetota bacterium]
MTWSDGTRECFGPGGDFSAAIEINDEATLWSALVNNGSVGLGASYIEGSWSTLDLAGFLEVASINVDSRRTSAVGRTMLAFVRRWWDRRPIGAKSTPIGEIGEHYNLGNDFYASWLDESMTYSSALFSAASDSLEVAQEAKYQRLCELLDLRAGDRVLEIGCGWGGFAEYATTRFGVHLTGLTLSVEMASFARERLAKVGMSHMSDIRVQDFRDETQIFDKVVSIEMIESIPADTWPELFETIHRVLAPEGRLAMQAILIDDRFYSGLVQRSEFIKTYIFPGGDLPSQRALEELSSGAELQWVEAAHHGGDYARTLALWTERFEEGWDRIQSSNPEFDVRFQRMWRYYLAYCEAGFRTGRLDGIQVLMERR